MMTFFFGADDAAIDIAGYWILGSGRSGGGRDGDVHVSPSQSGAGAARRGLFSLARDDGEAGGCCWQVHMDWIDDCILLKIIFF